MNEMLNQTLLGAAVSVGAAIAWLATARAHGFKSLLVAVVGAVICLVLIPLGFLGLQYTFAALAALVVNALFYIVCLIVGRRGRHLAQVPTEVEEQR